MVCIDQYTGKRNQEPFVTLAKTRRFEGKVWFGCHATLVQEGRQGEKGKICVGEAVLPMS